MPKPLTAKIWEQCVRDNANAPDKAAFGSSAFDLQKNVYTTIKFNVGANGKKEMLVTLPEPDGREPNDHSRFKVILQHANTVDLDSVMRFCKKEKQTTQEQETVVSTRPSPCHVSLLY